MVADVRAQLGPRHEAAPAHVALALVIRLARSARWRRSGGSARFERAFTCSRSFSADFLTIVRSAPLCEARPSRRRATKRPALLLRASTTHGRHCAHFGAVILLPLLSDHDQLHVADLGLARSILCAGKGRFLRLSAFHLGFAGIS